jgi:hypothetical protein
VVACRWFSLEVWLKKSVIGMVCFVSFVLVDG